MQGVSGISLAQEASLILATFQLLEVKAVTGAIRAADLASGGVLTPSGIVEKAPPPVGRFSNLDPQPVYEPRRHIYPSPVYERPRVIHVQPRIAEKVKPAAVPPAPMIPDEPTCKLSSPSPIEPPWKVLPWMDRFPKPPRVMREVVKVMVAAPDNSHSGLMVDILV